MGINSSFALSFNTENLTLNQLELSADSENSPKNRRKQRLSRQKVLLPQHFRFV